MCDQLGQMINLQQMFHIWDAGCCSPDAPLNATHSWFSCLIVKHQYVRSGPQEHRQEQIHGELDVSLFRDSV